MLELRGVGGFWGGDLAEEVGVLLFPEGRHLFLAGDGPDVVEGWFGDAAGAGDEHLSAIGLDADGGAVGAADLYAAIEGGVLGVAYDDVSEGAVFEADD